MGRDGYPRLENGSSTFGVDTLGVDAPAAMAMRSDWKFYALASFCYTFRPTLRLPRFTLDQLGESRVVELALGFKCLNWLESWRGKLVGSLPPLARGR